MRAGQIWQWIYQKGVREFSAMTNLAKAYRAELEATFDIAVPEVVSKQVSLDGTRKYLMRIAGGHEVEVVYIPEEGSRHAVHLQPGGLHADLPRFCHTGTQKLCATWTAGEIIGQVMVARDDHDEWPRPGEGSGERPRLISKHRPHGHGRAALQFRECARCDEDRHGWRRHRHIAPPHHVVDIRRGARDRTLRRGDRLHAGGVVPCHDGRGARPAGADQQSVGTSRRFWTRFAPIPKVSNSERITFEYVMLKDVNDSDEDARRLVQLIRGISGQDQPDPVQRMARRPLRSVGLDPDRTVRRHHLQGRLRLTDPPTPSG